MPRPSITACHVDWISETLKPERKFWLFGVLEKLVASGTLDAPVVDLWARRQLSEAEEPVEHLIAANWMMKRAVETSGGAVVQEFSPRIRRRIKLDGLHRDLLDRALWGGVNETGGTAHKARLAGVDVAGKTGSAQVSHRRSASGDDLENTWYFNRDHAWFAGYSPSGTPEVAVVVLIEHGGGGGKHAAPVAFEIIQAYQQLREAERKKAINDAKGTAP